MSGFTPNSRRPTHEGMGKRRRGDKKKPEGCVLGVVVVGAVVVVLLLVLVEAVVVVVFAALRRLLLLSLLWLYLCLLSACALRVSCRLIAQQVVFWPTRTPVHILRYNLGLLGSLLRIAPLPLKLKVITAHRGCRRQAVSFAVAV